MKGLISTNERTKNPTKTIKYLLFTKGLRKSKHNLILYAKVTISYWSEGTVRPKIISKNPVKRMEYFTVFWAYLTLRLMSRYERRMQPQNMM